LQLGEFTAQPLSISNSPISISPDFLKCLSCIALYPCRPIGAALFFGSLNTLGIGSGDCIACGNLCNRLIPFALHLIGTMVVTVKPYTGNQ
jgi:hypothetical protein